MLESYAPDSLFAHALTRGFVRAYVNESHGDADAIDGLRRQLPGKDGFYLEKVLLAKGRATSSELEPVRILEEFLRRLWVDHVRRRLGEMPVNGGESLDRDRLALSVRMKRLKNAPWQVARTLMVQPRLLFSRQFLPAYVWYNIRMFFVRERNEVD